jgi:hypothetical protein
VLGSVEGASCTSRGVWDRIIGYDGAAVYLPSDVRVVATGPGAQNFRRVAFTSQQNRFLSLWSEAQAGFTAIKYRVGDTTGGLSPTYTIPSGGEWTPELEDDGYTENAVTLDAAGTFSIVSRGNPPAGISAGQLYFHRLDADGKPVGSMHALPAWGTRVRIALTSNTITGQLLAVFVDGNGHLRAITIGTVTPTTVTLRPSSTTIDLSQTLTLTATVSGGAAPHEVAFWRYDVTREKWFEAQAYGTSMTTTWTPTSSDVGTHVIQVWARSAGSTSSYEAWQSVTVAVDPPQALKVQLASSRTFPVAAGTPVTWTATTSGGSGPAEYQFWIYNAVTSAWTVGRAYSTTNAYTWVPSTAGTYVVQVWARTVGSTVSNEAWAGSGNLKVNAMAPLTVRSLTPSTSTATPGTVVTWTAQATGGMAPLEYQFWRYNQDLRTWTMVQPYGTSATYSWTPAATDGASYTVQVWMRSAGSTASQEAWLSANTVTVTNVTVKALTSSTATRKVGTPITWTASAAKTAGTLEYQFWIYSVTAGTWQLARTYNTSASFTWTPTTAGSYTVQVWVRTVGNGRSYEAWLNYGPFTINP